MIGDPEQATWRVLATQFKKHQNLCTSHTFKSGNVIVENGIFVSSDAHPSYASVPLAFIQSGTVVIIDNGKAVKYYSKGDCLGLFETAYFLQSGLGGRIGRWNVLATSDVNLLVTSAPFLKAMPMSIKDMLLKTAKRNPIPKPLTQLPLLDWFAKAYGIQPRENTAIVYHSHVLPSSQELIKHLAYIAGPTHTFVLEKPYSTIIKSFRHIAESGVHSYQLRVDPYMSYEYSIKRGIDYFWHDVTEYVHTHDIQRVIVVSDGADALLSPLIKEMEGVEVIGVEQTTRGIQRFAKRQATFPIISIAATYAKTYYESPFIAKAALAKLLSLDLINKNLKYGIVGAGNIGKGIIRGLQAYGIRPAVYDTLATAPLNSKLSSSLEDLIRRSDIIIGTTGQDSLRGMHIARLTGTKTFVSASSSNIEFAYLFDLAKNYANTFEDVVFRTSPTCTMRVLNGGYPINFDRTREWESPDDIQLTRTLLYAAVYEALNNPILSPGIRLLNPTLEKNILDEWIKIRS